MNRECACGCGQLVTPRAIYRHGHWAKANREVLSAMRTKTVAGSHGDGYLTLNRRLEHILVAEKALGKQLPRGAVVHHINTNRADNRPQNLVICPNAAYHALLHKRMRAIDACGNPNWMRCAFCKQYDDPKNLYISPSSKGTVEHRACGRVYRAKRLKERTQC